MASLALFCEKSTGISQTAGKAFGVDTNVDIFRLNSVFTVTGIVKAYAMVQGTILLQQQTGVPDKVNLILRPHDQSNFKLPIKYIVYRGLNTTDFIDNNDLSDTNNKVKTTGSELLVKMQTIQQGRAPGVVIPVQALFGNELAPAGTKNIDEFFFKNLAPASQLFTIDCGMELGNFVAGEVAVEIVLENPEYYLTVADAKALSHEINVSGITNAPERKWKQDLVRHFVDPAAYYGLHHDIAGGIEYRTASGKQFANTPALVYNQIVDKFLTKSKVYIDVRNENGYSYNYYGNYVGTGADANKNIKVGQTAASLVAKEYNTNGWAIHAIDVTAGSGSVNDIFVALRINDNERPLLAGWNYALINSSGTGSIVTDVNISFADEKVLLGDPLPTTLPDFSNAISFKVPNIGGTTPAQLSTVIRLDYTKQLRVNDGVDAFPQHNPTDYLFGPVSTVIPWDSSDKVQWISNGYHKYFDGLNHGLLRMVLGYTVTSVDYSLNKLTISGTVASSLYDNIFTMSATGTNRSIVLNILAITENTSLNTSTIEVQETLPAGIVAGDFVVLYADKMCSLDRDNRTFIITGENLSTVPTLQPGNPIWHHFKLDIDEVDRKYVIASIQFTGGNTNIEVTTDIKRYGLGALMTVGMVKEQPTQDNILFYAIPTSYYNKIGSADSRFFNYKGGTKKETSFLATIQSFNPNFQIFKTTIEVSAGVVKSLLVHFTQRKAKDNILLLGITQSEWNNLITQSSNPISGRNFSDFHLKNFKLSLQSPLTRSIDFKPYYHYKLVLSGLGTDGNYIETLVTNGIDIYSIDGLVFSSDQYAQQTPASNANYSISFNRRSNYISKGGHYGFDWIRPEFIAETDPSPGRGGICIPHAFNITKQEAQDQLKQVFTPLNIINEDYFVPWLSLYKNHATIVADGQPVVADEHNVIIDLGIKRATGFSTAFGPQDVVRFDTPDGITVSPNPIPANAISGTSITISCQDNLSTNNRITAYDQNNNLLGALNILQNDITYRCEVRFVKINLRGILTGKDVVVNSGYGNFDIKTNFNTQKIDLTLMGIPSSSVNFNMTQKFNAWTQIFNNAEKNAKYLFYQSLIKFDPIKSSGQIDYSREITIDFGNYTILTSLPNTTPLNRLKNMLRGIDTDGNIQIDDSTEQKLVDFIDVVNELYLAQHPSNTESVTVFVFPCNVVGATQSNTAGASNGVDNAKCILPMVQTSFELDKTLLHETAHSLGLVHSFQVDAGAVHSFLEYHTENIMDYVYPTPAPPGTTTPNPLFTHSVYGISFFQWQIIKMKSDPDLKIE